MHWQSENMWAALWLALSAFKCDHAKEKNIKWMRTIKELKFKSSVKLLVCCCSTVWCVLIKKLSGLQTVQAPSVSKTHQVHFKLSLCSLFRKCLSCVVKCIFDCLQIDSFFLVLATVEFRSSMDGSVCTQEPSMKSSMVLPTKKSVGYPGDHQDNPAKPPLYHKQPPALPPKPFSRIPNHSTGQLS